MWVLSGVNGDPPWDTRRTMIQKVSMIGTPSTSRATATLAVPRMARTASVNPTNWTPLVPVKIDAGWKFQRRNPSRAPARAKHNTATSGWPTWVVRLITPNVTAAMNDTPDESPSRPSIQLILLIIPTIQKIVKATATGPE